MRPATLPARLVGRPFTVGQGRSAGVSRQRMRAPDLLAPYRGVRCGPRLDPASLLHATQLVLPETAAFSHGTALWVLGLPVRADLAFGPVHITVPLAAPRPRIRGVKAHRSATLPAVTDVRGLRVVAAESAWSALGRSLTRDELVVLGDAIAHNGTVGADRLAAEVALRRRTPGVPRLREALPEIRAGSASPMETLARLVMLRGGLPEPELNADIVDVVGGWVARGDFVWRVARLVAEYDGEHHRTSARQWRSDILRSRVLRDAGWRVEVVTAADVLRFPDQLVARLGLILDQRPP